MADTIDDKIDRKLGVIMEQVNDQFERVLEAVDSRTEPIQRISDKIEVIESKTIMQGLEISSIRHDTKMLKLRSDKEESTKNTQTADIKKLEKRVAKLESV